MKPDFALLLSFEGIRLLHRAAGGWRLVGEVDVADPNLSEALEHLRKTANDLAPGRLLTKLIIPNDQIKYISVDTGEKAEVDRRIAARFALDGATPYPVEDLAFDIAEEGPITHVAAVARETLAEAEAFADQHKFNPISFVAAPTLQDFTGEPFFGLSSQAESLLPGEQKLERDVEPVVEIGLIDIPEGPVVAEVAEEDVPTSEGEAPGAADPMPKPVAVAEVAEEPEAPAQAELPLAPDTPAPEAEDDTPPVAPEETAEPPEPVIGFSSRRRPAAKAAPALGGVQRNAPVNKPAAPTPAPVSTPELDIPADVSPTPPPAAEPALLSTPMPADDVFDTAIAPPPAMPAQVTKATTRKGFGGFLSRRKKPAVAAAGHPAPAGAAVTTTPDEAHRMTIFGARKPVPPTQQRVGGKPRYLGLVLTAILIILLAGVAAWASIFTDSSFARLFAPRTNTTIVTLPEATLPSAPEVEDQDIIALPEQLPEDAPRVASLGLTAPELSSEDEAVLDALRDPEPEPQLAPEIVVAPPLTPEELEARYAVTGIWPKAPAPTTAPMMIPLDNLYRTSIDPATTTQDAVALPMPEAGDQDVALLSPASPASPGTAFALDERGLVRPTPQGALSPDGVLVFLGPPPVKPSRYPERADIPQPAEVAPSALSKIRPKGRPSDLAETNERATLGGLTRSELADYRPELRPITEKQVVEENEADAPPTANAVLASLRPDSRPSNFGQIVARAEPRAPQRDTTRDSERSAIAAAVVAPRTVTPSIPSSASVTREATVRNAINLNRVNLIGVYGTPSSRRALVRLSNGRYKKVKVGDRIDGGRVSAIGDGELRYKKGNRNLVLKMPKG